uniref:Serrate RNA effector molecule homolog n=1 Tax=Ditylenchus dipsaci TaxID=166011 RepID=A0A915CMF5_9BILA
MILHVVMPENDEDFERVSQNRDKFARERVYRGRIRGRGTFNMDTPRRDCLNAMMSEKQECEIFFQTHKDEEWFRLKYHPKESVAIKEEHGVLETDLEKLGKRDEEKAVEEFIAANCGPEFIRKHLQSKHQDKLDEVRHEVLYFNNYLVDVLRRRNSESKTLYSMPTLQNPGNFDPMRNPGNFDPMQNVGIFDPMQNPGNFDPIRVPSSFNPISNSGNFNAVPFQQAVIKQEDCRPPEFEIENATDYKAVFPAHGRSRYWQGNDFGGNIRNSVHTGGRGIMTGYRESNKRKYFDPNSDVPRDPRQQKSYRDLDMPENDEDFERVSQNRDKFARERVYRGRIRGRGTFNMDTPRRDCLNAMMSEKQECEIFFQTHKDEEWFRLKYHPKESVAIKEEHGVLETDLEKLGKRDEEKAVEEFIAANCVELAKDRWHLQSKHQDKLDEVRHEVLYFNNYLVDVLRRRNSESKTLYSMPTLQNPGNFDPMRNPGNFDPMQNVGIFDPMQNPGNFDPMPLQQVVIGRRDCKSQEFVNRSAYGRIGNWQGDSIHADGRGFITGYRDSNEQNYFDADYDVPKDPRQQTSYRDLDAVDEIF